MSNCCVCLAILVAFHCHVLKLPTASLVITLRKKMCVLQSLILRSTIAVK